MRKTVAVWWLYQLYVRLRDFRAITRTDDFLGRMGPGQLSPGACKRIRGETGVKVTVETTPWPTFKRRPYRIQRQGLGL